MALVTDGAGQLSFQYAGTASGIVVTQMQDLNDVITNLNASRNDRDILMWDSAVQKYGTVDFDDYVRANISVADSATGYGSLSYNSTTGVITNTRVTVENIRSAFDATGDLAYDSATGIFSLDVEVSYTSTNFDSDLSSSSTTNLPEGTNLYYTNARADGRIAAATTDDLSEGVTNKYYLASRHDSDFDLRLAIKSTSNVTEGTNLYWTTARGQSMFDTRLATKSTANVAEGSNLYYTDARADSAIDVKITQAYIKATGITFDDVTDNNATTTNTVTIGQLNTTGGIVQHTPAVAATISSDSTTLIDATVHNSGFTSIEYIVQINNDSASETQISKITAAFDKTAVSISEFGIVHTGDSDLGTFTADVSGGDIRLFFQRRPSNTITLKSTKTIIQ